MASKRQHYIPRFLLRGFASQARGNKVLTWYFRKGRPPVEVSLRDIGLGKSFYDSSLATGLDQGITAREKALAEMLSRVRNEHGVRASDLDLLVEFLVLTICRTSHVRQALGAAVKGTLQRVGQRLTRPDELERLFALEFRRSPEKFRKYVIDAIRKQWGGPNPIIETVAMKMIEGNLDFIVREFAKEGAEFVSCLLPLVENDAPRQMGEHHKKALKDMLRDLRGTPRFKEYANLRWSVRRPQDGHFILGDVCVMEIDSQTLEISSAIKSGPGSGTILFPVAHNCILVGTSSPEAGIPSHSEVNAQSAELSVDFFVSAVKTPELETLASNIGKRASLVSEAELDEIERETFDTD